MSTPNPVAPASSVAPPSARIKEFRSLIKRAILLDRAETALFDSIPDLLLERILVKNFNDNMALAERVLLNKYHEIDKLDKPLLEQKKRNIKNFDKAAAAIREAMTQGKKVLFLTDNDNDGSMAQAVFLEFHAALPKDMQPNVQRAYAQPIGASRGLNKENIDVMMEFLGWSKDEEVLVVTADIGINNRAGQDDVLAAYPNMSLVITDHHLPDVNNVVQDNKRTIIFNPQWHPTDFFKKKNISGANTLSVVLKEVLATLDTQTIDLWTPDLKQTYKNMDEISAWSNLLDYVEADIADMPLRPYTIANALNLRALMNVSNSVATMVTLDWTQQDWDDLAASEPSLPVDKIKNIVNTIKSLNVFAKKLLSLASEFRAETTTFSKKDFFEMLSEKLTDPDATFDTPNPNYLAQLRPHIFRYAAIDNKYAFFEAIKDQMVALFEEARRSEKELVNMLRSVELLESVRAEHSTIVYPKIEKLTKLFGRKLLNKIYNEENNGFFLTLDKTQNEEYSGSMRSLYSVFDILKDKEDIENTLNVDIEILGHAKAAGFKIRGRNGVAVTPKTLSALNTLINERVEAIKIEEKAQALPFLNIDFASVGLVQEINTAVKGHLSNMATLPTVMRLGAAGRDTIWVTDSKTSAQVSLSEVVATRKYGYQAIQTDFHGHAFVVPVEQLRTVVNNKFRPVVKMSYMDDGVFIASQVVDPKSLKNLIEFRGDRSEQESLIGYYLNTYRDDHVIPLQREDFFNLPYFRFNAYGPSEFEHFEQLIISLLEKTNQDMLAVIDTEGTGLGQAPKCFNIGGTNIKIKEGSGQELDEQEFDRRMFRDASGQAYLLSEQDVANVSSTPLANGWKMFNTTDKGTDYEQECWLPSKPANAIKITNHTRKNGKVLINRTIDGTAFSYLIKDEDLHITQELENLTGISQKMIDALGTPTEEVDEALCQYYKELTNANGEPAKIIFSAHNLPYDKGVISANFEKFNTLMEDHVLCDTAKLARQAKLAYDDTPVTSFENVSGLPRQIYFYDSPYSNYSLTTFLDRVAKNKSGVYPDTTGRYLLRFSADTGAMSLIDKEKFNEFLLDETCDSLLGKRITSQLPNNAVKYSVERLSMRAMIRNIILHNYEKPKTVTLEASEQPYAAELQVFQEQYHFDSTLDDNIRFFLSSMHNKASTVSMTTLEDVGVRFLRLNKTIQAKFHDGWIYEKVLSQYEPAINEGKVSQDAINQINYYTDLPRKKIEEVIADTISFEKKFGTQRALFHEQHNNIRQRSVDGQGLSDTAYESVVANLLAMMKYYNPYTQSSEEAVSAIVETNMKGAMVQLLVKKEHQDMAAIDSFSMRQMQTFDRDNKTNLIAKAQSWKAAGGWDNQLTPIRFKLDQNTLPVGSGIYGVPLRPLTEEEIQDSSDKLNFILINEQLRSAAAMSRSISFEHSDRLREVASHNDTLAMTYRDVIMTRFSKVEFQRKEATIKKLSELMGQAFEGHEPRFTDSLIKEVRKNPALLDTATALQVTYHNINCRLGKPKFLAPTTVEKVNELLDGLYELSGVDEEASLNSGKIKRAARAKKDKGEMYDGSSVRHANFLPELEIRRDEPLKFVLEQGGPGFFGPYLLKQAEQPAPIVTVQATPAPKMR